MLARSVLASLIAAAAGGAGAADPGLQPPGPKAPPPVPDGTVLAAPGLQLHYQPLAGGPGPGRLEGVASGSAGELRSSLRIDAAGEHTLTRVETRWQTRGPGLLQNVEIGDTHASGGGWSQPARLGGLRFGRPLALRTDPAAPLDRAAQVKPAPRLAAGAADYEVELGRLRSGWNAADGSYGQPYAAAAYRAGLTTGLTAEARTEHTQDRQAQGLELVGGLGAGNSVQALLAQSATPQDSGLRWGLGVVRDASGAAWTLGWDAYERGFAPLTAAGGEAHPRSRLRAAASLPLPGRVSANLSYAQQASWDNATPATVLGLAARMPFLRRSSVALDYSWRDGPVPVRRAGLVLALPLDDGAR